MQNKMEEHHNWLTAVIHNLKLHISKLPENEPMKKALQEDLGQLVSAKEALK